MEFKLGLLAVVVLLGTILGVMQTQAQGISKPAVGALLSSKARFCGALDDKINSLSLIESSAKTFAQAQTDTSAIDYNKDRCEDALEFNADVCQAREDAEFFRHNHCGGLSQVPLEGSCSRYLGECS